MMNSGNDSEVSCGARAEKDSSVDDPSQNLERDNQTPDTKGTTIEDKSTTCARSMASQPGRLS